MTTRLGRPAKVRAVSSGCKGRKAPTVVTTLVVAKPMAVTGLRCRPSRHRARPAASASLARLRHNVSRGALVPSAAIATSISPVSTFVRSADRGEVTTASSRNAAWLRVEEGSLLARFSASGAVGTGGVRPGGTRGQAGTGVNAGRTAPVEASRSHRLCSIMGACRCLGDGVCPKVGPMPCVSKGCGTSGPSLAAVSLKVAVGLASRSREDLPAGAGDMS